MQRVDQRVRSARPPLFDGAVPQQRLQIAVDGRRRQLCGRRDRGKGLLTRAEAPQGTQYRHGARHGSAGAVGCHGSLVQQRDFPLAVADQPVSHNAHSIRQPILLNQDRDDQALIFPVREFQEQKIPAIRCGERNTARRGEAQG
ncbi:hypothetical protein GCM10010326_37480 [Streptomyces xanthochromogenes]|uniref:Uncharacterized protein n=1 Tax=Streptomyces xanthochromogenes TaxID=67384 RepID=A0ABQ3AAW0_9ACTN|nr:hypothetical protein GCM10010326_37480 [Streptomyces xanthochromogenes]